MKQKFYTVTELLRAIQIKEKEIAVLRKVMEGQLEAERIMAAMPGNGSAGGAGTVWDVKAPLISATLFEPVRGLSPLHGALLKIVAEHSPTLVGDVRKDLDGKFYPATDTATKRKLRLSHWLNELKRKGIIAPDPKNTGDRNMFRWIVTDKGRQYLAEKEKATEDQ